MKLYTRVIAKTMAVSLLLATSLIVNEHYSIKAAPPDRRVKVLAPLRSDVGHILFIQDFGEEGVDKKRIPVFGLPEGEKLILVDFLERDPTLNILKFVALSSSGKLYELAGSEEPQPGDLFTQLSLDVVGEFKIPIPPPFIDDEPAFDHDLVNKFLNITDNMNRSHLISMTTGQTQDVTRPFTFDPLDLNTGNTPNIKGLAYDNNVEGAIRSFLYGVDTNTDSFTFIFDLIRGLMITKGSLGINAMKAELDIFSKRTGSASSSGRAGAAGDEEITNMAFALITVEGETLPGLYEIDLSTGRATKFLSLDEPVQGFTVFSVEDAPDTASPEVRNVAVAGGAGKVKRGKTVSITWDATDNRAVSRQFVELSIDNGQTFNPISDQQPGDVRNFQWTVDENLAKSKKSFIRIRALDGADNEGEGLSQRIKIK